MSNSTRWVWLLLFSLVFPACRNIGPERLFSFATPTLPSLAATPDSTATPRPAGPFSIDLASAKQGLDGLQRYRAHLIVEFNGKRSGQPVTGALQSLTEITRSPLAEHRYLKTQTAIPEAGIPAGVSELFQVGGKVSMKQGDTGAWVTFSDDNVTPDKLRFFELDHLIVLPATVPGPPRRESLNRLQVQHYTFNEKDLADPNITFEKATGDLWLANPGNFLVQYTISATLRIIVPDPGAHILDEGQLNLRYSLTDINGNFSITPPVAALATGNLLAAFPRPPDAELVSNFPTLIEYTSAITPVRAVLFYRDELARLDWTETSATVFNEKAEMTYTKAEDIVTIIVNPADRPDRFKVLLHLNPSRR